MRILYITTYFDLIGSSAAVRNAGLVKGLVANGHVVDIITVQHPQEKCSKLFNDIGYSNITRVPLTSVRFVAKNNKKLGRINSNKFLKKCKDFLRNALFFPDIYKDWYKYIDYSDLGKYDIVISSSDAKSSHLPAWYIKKKYSSLKWIQIWGDPWSSDVGLDFLSKLRAKFAEVKFLKQADKIIYVSRFTCEHEINRHPRLATKMYYVPRSYFKSVNKNSVNIAKEFHITYAGGLNASRNCDELLESIYNYNIDSSIQFHVDYYGDYLPEIKKSILKYDNTHISPTVEYGAMLEVYEHSDALLFISNSVGSTQIPGKLFDYLGTNIPIICVVNSQDTRLITFIKQFDQCILFNGDFSSIADIVINSEYHSVQEFSPQTIAEQVLQ